MEAWCIPENSATSFAGRYLNACELLEVFPFQSLPSPVQITIAIRGRFVEFHVFGIASVTIHEKKGQPIASMGQIPVTYLTISGFRIKADDALWEGKETSVVLRYANFGAGILSLS
ncbi:hypothetical protein OAL47_01815 [Verrucomicrobia bacterium]|nr:hypothetical protein [Verrucomicrobiota bacterium]